MVSMFSEIEKSYKEEFIKFYEEFISNPNDKALKQKAEGLGMNCGSQFSKEINSAAFGADKIELGELSVGEAKKILEELKEQQ